MRGIIKTSIIIPVYNEAENIVELHKQIIRLAPLLDGQSEIIFIDDGSTDNSAAIIAQLCDSPLVNMTFRLISLRGNQGKTAALRAGFQMAEGRYICTMDADLQDDPAELPRLLAGLEQFDMVAAYRVNRYQNDPLAKTLPSKLYNWTVRTMTGVELHDFNCGMKAYRYTALKGLRLYGELHRFIPVLVAQQGHTITEIAVNHRPRYAGVSKFGHSRLLRGLLDFVTVIFLTRYLNAPVQLFGVVGLVFGGIGAFISTYFALLWAFRLVGLMDVAPIGDRPLFAVGIFLIMAGINLLGVGLIGEMVRHFHAEPLNNTHVHKAQINGRVRL